MTGCALRKVEDEPLIVRRAHGGDLDDVVLLLGYLGYPSTRNGLREIFETIIYDQRMTVLLGCLGHSVAGLITARLFPSLRLNGLEVSIEEFVVHPSHRGMGIGRALLGRVLGYAREHGAVRVETHTSHTRESYRRGFYIKNGFLPAQSTIYRMELRREE